MVVNFSSLEFLFRFLPVFLILYFIVPRKYRELTLLVGSFVFYAFGDLKFLLVLALLILLNYALASASWKQQEGYSIQEWQQQKRKRYLTMAVFLDAGALLLFKCLGVFVSETLLPLGISFYIFKMISFQADVYKKEIFSKPKLKYVALYFSLFPQVISGPIMRYGEGEFELDRTCGPEELEEGLFYFVSGLGMKVLLADRLAILWNDLQMIGFQSISTPLAWLGALGYSLQLYFDFWGYSLMASGLMVILGFPFIQNFDHPYASKSIAEFYRRWHMTLGSWFRDYVYIPMGGSRCTNKRLVRNLALVWVLTGLWHGSGINFLIWGGLLGLFIILEKLFYGKYLAKLPVLGHLYVLVLIPLSWVIFALTDLKELCLYFSRLFPFFGEGIAVHQGDFLKYAENYGIFFVAGILLCIPASFRFLQKHRKNPAVLLLMLLVFWACVYLISGSAGNPFMYLKF